MTRIALVTTSYPDTDTDPGMAAAGSFVEDFAVELSRSVQVSVIAASLRESTTREGRLTIRRFCVPRLPLSLLRPERPWHWAPIVKSLSRGRKALRECIQEDAPDHIFALWALPSGWWANVECGRASLPYSIWALGSDIWSYARLPVARQLLRKALTAAQRRYADGIQLCADVEGIGGGPCEFLPSARRLDSERVIAASTEPPYKLAFLGRWHPNKGIDLMLDALEHLAHSDWAGIAEVRIYGGGPLEPEVRSACARLVNAGRPIVIGGYLGKQDAAALIGWADYLMLPSRIESIPVLFSDAAQLRTALIATPVGDLPRLHEQYGFGVIAESADAAAFSRAIQRAIRTRPGHFSAGLEEAATQFGVAAIADRLLRDIDMTPGVDGNRRN